jgi:hypothetical protein
MNIITPLVQFQQQLRIYHWQTNLHAQHVAFGSAYEELDELIDTFIETYMGIFGKSKPFNDFTLILNPLIDIDHVYEKLEDFISYLKEMTYDIEGETDLLNIRDSILGEVNHLKYLLSLK